MKTSGRVLIHCLIGTALALLSTFISPRSALVSYPDIMGCEEECKVVATGWPFTFVSDYLGMSVVGSASILEVWLAADRFAWAPFLLNVGVWALVSTSVLWIISHITRTLRTPEVLT